MTDYNQPGENIDATLDRWQATLDAIGRNIAVIAHRVDQMESHRREDVPVRVVQAFSLPDVDEVFPPGMMMAMQSMNKGLI